MEKARSQGYWSIVWRQFRRRKIGLAGLAIIVLMGLIALLAPFIAGDVPLYLLKDGQTFLFPNVITYSTLQEQNLYANFDRWRPGAGDRAVWPPVAHGPNRQNLSNRLAAPNATHWLGTDDRGRDVLSRMVWGARVSMSVGFVAVGLAVLVGVLLGALAGYYGGWVDALVLRIIEIVLVFPSFFLVITVMAFLPPNILNIMAVIGLTSWPGIARLVRGEFLKNKQSDYLTAARVVGLRDTRIMARHLLPNSLSPVFVAATFGVAGAILTESALSFLGFGVPPPAASWGETLKQSQAFVDFAWWLVVFPGLAIFVTVVGFNLVGETLRDAMDPRLRE